LRARDREAQQRGIRFAQDEYDPDEREIDVQFVWPGCIADIVLPSRASRDGEDRRASLLADYGDRVFMLDPAKPGNGEASSSRIAERCWRLDWREG
jgi:hypothetical protein